MSQISEPSNEPAFSFDLVLPKIVALNRKQIIGVIAKEAAKLTGVKDRILAERMIDQSGKDHTSMISEGAELSHLRISGLSETISIFVTFKNPVSFDAADKKIVDVFCLILTPEREQSTYLRTIARVSRLLRNKQMRKELHEAKDAETLRTILNQSSVGLLAA